jgi:hypothetical protein
VARNKQGAEVHRILRINHSSNVVSIEVLGLYCATLDVVFCVIVLLKPVILALDCGAGARL